jgi:hypothetical protein
MGAGSAPGVPSVVSLGTPALSSAALSPHPPHSIIQTG